MSAGFLARLGATLATTAALALLLGSCGGKANETYTGSGGSSNSGGSGGLPDCATVRCAAPTCPDGQVAIKAPGACCASCPSDPNCTNVVCADPICQPGSHVEVPDGRCCPECVFDSYCDAGKTGWQTRFDILTAELDAFSCNVTEDCTVASLGSLCKFDCGTAVNVSSAATLRAQLNAWGEEACVLCPQPGITCPPDIINAVCTDGVCEIL